MPNTADYRRFALRRRKAQALMASNYPGYQQLGAQLMDQLNGEAAAEAQAQRQLYEDTLKEDEIRYRRGRDVKADEQKAVERDALARYRDAELSLKAAELGMTREQFLTRQRQAERQFAAGQGMKERELALKAAEQGLSREQFLAGQGMKERELALKAAEQGVSREQFQAGQAMKERELALKAAEQGVTQEQFRAQQALREREQQAIETNRTQRLGLDERALTQQEQLHNQDLAAMLPSEKERVTPEGSPIPTVPGGKPTEAQRKALIDSAISIARLRDAYRLFREHPEAYGGANTVLGAIGSIHPMLRSAASRAMSKETRQVRNQIEDITSGILRQEAGQSMTEFEALKRQFLPSEYDSSAQNNEKFRNLFKRQITTYKANGGLDDVPMPPDLPGSVDDIVKKYKVPQLQKAH